MEWTTACADWERRIVARESLIVSPPLYPKVAAEAWEKCSGFRLVDVAGQPTIGEASLPWLRDLVLTVFGAEDPEEGRRRINEFMIMVSKKNAKSTIAAAIMLTAVLMNWRQSAELLILSPTKEIADNSYKPIRDFIKADEALDERLKVQDYFRTITDLETNSTLKVVAADSDTVGGKKASFVFVDELHEFGKNAKASNMLLEATGGLTSRPEGFTIFATTQSAEPPAGVFRSKLLYARKVRDGIIEDRKFLPVLYEFPQSMLEAKAYEDLSNAYVTNPNWGASVDIERITQLRSQAKEEGPKQYAEFLAKHLNVEIGLALASDRWAGADFWQQQADKTLTRQSLMERCEVVTAGIDGGGLDDLLGLTMIGRERETKRWLTWSHAWAHKIVLERRKDIAPRLLDFAADGDLTIVNKPGDDVFELVAMLVEVRDAGLMPDKLAIGVDAAGIEAIYQALIDSGFTEEQIVAISQGWRLNGAIKTAERKLAGGEMVNTGCALMNWCVGNAKVEPKGNAISITKQASGTAKIDPLMALFDAVDLMSRAPDVGGMGAFMDFISERTAEAVEA